MSTTKKENWFSDLNQEGIEKGKEILPNFELPQVGESPRNFTILDEPFVIDTPNAPHNKTMTKVKVDCEGAIGEIILPKSLRHSIAVSLEQMGKDHTQTTLTGYVMEVSQTKGTDGYNYYNCVLRNA